SSAAVWGAGEVGPYIEITNFSPITATILDGSHDENNLSTDENAFTDAPAEGSIYKFTRNLIEPKYSFAASTGTYTPISGTVISTAGFDDESHFNINLPFTMTVNGIEYTSVHVSTNGLLFDEANFTDIVLINSLDLGDNASNTASISILTEGVSPNRIFKIQFKDLACVNDANNADFVNMQIWLLENGQKIEFHYGNFSVVNQDSYDGESGSLVGILESALVGIYVKGDDSSPISSGIAGNYTLIPAEGKVFTFTPLFPLSTRKAGAGLQFQVFPNPSQGTFQVQLGESIQTASVHVYNTLGNELYTSQLSNTSNTITTSLDKGMYVLKIVDANGASASRMLVVE
ncbi:MAG: T9SS type A sorting domain-containing protein, partial [Cytophagaceae bacterium]|nr:T9SS type A sorting domain-containing protein [Cytophagaceae bacterium]